MSAAKMPSRQALALVIALSLTPWCLDGRLSAAETADPGAAPVVIIDGKPITLRQVEDALLKKEGTEAFEEWVHTHLAQVDWAAVGDNDPLITVAGSTLTRRQLALALLKPPNGQPAATGAVREDLINTTLVEQALVKEGVAIDQAALDGAWSSMERQFQAKQKNAREKLDFASVIRAKEGMAPEDFRKQAGFRMFAGLRALALKRARAELAEADLMRWFDDHHARYDVLEAVELADIYIPYTLSKDHDGKDVIEDSERHQLMQLVLNFFSNIRDKQQTFETVWATFKRWDPQAGEGGRIGWVARDGVREIQGGRRMPAEVMEQALAATTLPALLQPIPSATGVDLVRVDGRRPGKQAIFADVSQRVLVDLVEDQLDERMGRTLEGLRRAANIRYQSLPDLIDQRAGGAP